MAITNCLQLGMHSVKTNMKVTDKVQGGYSELSSVKDLTILNISLQ